MVYDHPRTHNSYGDVSGVMMSSADNVTDSLSNELSDTSALEYGQCALRGSLFKKEKFTWVKLFCIIRNNFLECHKSHGDFQSPNLKLFLPGSEVKEVGGDAKKKWTFQVSTDIEKKVLCIFVYFDHICTSGILTTHFTVGNATCAESPLSN